MTRKMTIAPAIALKFSQTALPRWDFEPAECDKGRAFSARPFFDAVANYDQPLRCLLTRRVISNIETCLAPPKIGRRLSSALI